MIADLTQQRDDLEAVGRDYVARSLSFTDEGRRRAHALLAQARASERVLEPVEYLALLARVTACADNGHDFLDTGDGWWPSTRLPLRTEWFDDGLVVTRGDARYRTLLGQRIVAVEGRPLRSFLEGLHTAFGGPDALIRWSSQWALEWGGILHALGLAAQSDRVAFTYADGAGETTVEVPFVAADRCPSSGPRATQLMAGPTDDESSQGWLTARQGTLEPLWLQEPSRWFRVQRLPRLEALYVQFRTHFSFDSDPMEAFLKAVEAELLQPPRHLVLDVRLDSGGNSDLTIELMNHLVARVPGRLFVLVGPRTFSAGIVTAALVKSLAGSRALFVGEAMGDRPRWWSEGRNVRLPHSGYFLRLSDGLWDLRQSCADEAGCYSDRFGIRVDSLEVDVPAALTVEAWVQGRDPALEKIEGLLSIS